MQRKVGGERESRDENRNLQGCQLPANCCTAPKLILQIISLSTLWWQPGRGTLFCIKLLVAVVYWYNCLVHTYYLPCWYSTQFFNSSTFDLNKISLFPKWKNMLNNVWLKQDFCFKRMIWAFRYTILRQKPAKAHTIGHVWERRMSPVLCTVAL